VGQHRKGRTGVQETTPTGDEAMTSSADIRIRPYVLEDAAVLHEAVIESLTDLQPWMMWAHPGYTWDEARAWLEVQVPAFDARVEFQFAIVSAAGEYLGACGLNHLDTLNRRANLGYWVRSRAARMGIATRAVGLLQEWAFTYTNLVRLEILVAMGNAASRRVAIKSGALEEGLLRDRLLLNNCLHDAAMYSIVRATSPR
jgi:ribosomal-protein-serine acetyltransferase